MKVRQVDKLKVANVVLWLAYGLALMASVHHLAWAFGGMEFYSLLGWIPAVAIDGGLAAMAYGIQQRKRAKRQSWVLWLGVIVFCLISAFANLLHAAAVVSTDLVVTWQALASLEGLGLAKALILSASLPLLVVYLGEIVSSDDAEAARMADRETKRQEKIPAEMPVIEPVITPAVQPTSQQAEKVARMAELAKLKANEPSLSQTELANRLGVSRGSVRNYLAELPGFSKNGVH